MPSDLNHQHGQSLKRLLEKIGLIVPYELAPGVITFLTFLGYKIKALWTPNTDYTIRAASDYEIPFVATQPDEVLLRKDVQLVIITGYPSMTPQVITKALGVGKHVVCDVPLAMNGDHLVKIIQAVEYYPQLLAFNCYGMRAMNIYKEAKRLIGKGLIGSLNACEVKVKSGSLSCDQYNWTHDRHAGGGVLNLVGSHVIDLLTYLFDRRAVRVSGFVQCIPLSDASNASATDVRTRTVYRKTCADNFACFVLHFDGDFYVSVTLNALGSPDYFQEVLICGSVGQLVARNTSLFYVDLADSSPVEQLVCSESPTCQEVPFDYDECSDPRKRPSQHFLILYRLTFMKSLEVLHRSLFDSEARTADTSSALSHHGHIGDLTNFNDMLYVKSVIDAIRKSNDKKEWMKISS
ncbi:unnamed protein product [Soboliphyme baturini]|uniref:GFO_IDH_MocA domain-containing protein n=1 Tax=Soboliphyme baturini TaxID=241478 RepID=A0A183INF8_9BILA|nr:unnamed protein product [Soboliphyme baturini]